MIKNLKEKFLNLFDREIVTREKAEVLYKKILDHFEKEYFEMPLESFGLTGIEFSIFKLELVNSKLMDYLIKDKYEGEISRSLRYFKEFVYIEGEHYFVIYDYYFLPFYRLDISNLIFTCGYFPDCSRETRLLGVKESIEKFNRTKKKFQDREIGYYYNPFRSSGFNTTIYNYSDYDKKVLGFLSYLHNYKEYLNKH